MFAWPGWHSRRRGRTEAYGIFSLGMTGLRTAGLEDPRQGFIMSLPCGLHFKRGRDGSSMLCLVFTQLGLGSHGGYFSFGRQHPSDIVIKDL